MKIIAVDIGGTAIKIRSVEWDGIDRTKEWETQASLGGAHLVDRVKELIHTYQDFNGIGISTAGEVNTEDGSIFYANSNIPGYTGMQVKKIMEEEFHVPTAVENDVNAAALESFVPVRGMAAKDFLCLTYGTGVGGCIVADQKVYAGASYSAGSFGGIVIHPEEKGGTDSLEGCYERCASTTALVRRVKKIDGVLDNGKKFLLQWTERRSESRLICGSMIYAQVW